MTALLRLFCGVLIGHRWAVEYVGTARIARCERCDALAVTRPSLTRLFTNSSSGRNRYQPTPPSTTRPTIQARRFIPRSP